MTQKYKYWECNDTPILRQSLINVKNSRQNLSQQSKCKQASQKCQKIPSEQSNSAFCSSFTKITSFYLLCHQDSFVPGASMHLSLVRGQEAVATLTVTLYTICVGLCYS